MAFKIGKSCHTGLSSCGSSAESRKATSRETKDLSVGLCALGLVSRWATMSKLNIKITLT